MRTVGPAPQCKLACGLAYLVCVGQGVLVGALRLPGEPAVAEGHTPQHEGHPAACQRQVLGQVPEVGSPAWSQDFLLLVVSDHLNTNEEGGGLYHLENILRQDLLDPP